MESHITSDEIFWHTDTTTQKNVAGIKGKSLNTVAKDIENREKK